jgi:hypothetical protein
VTGNEIQRKTDPDPSKPKSREGLSVQRWEGKFLIVEKQVLELPISESGHTLQENAWWKNLRTMEGRKEVSVEFTVDPWKFNLVSTSRSPDSHIPVKI